MRSGVLIDINTYRPLEVRFQRANRALLALSEAGSALVRADSEPDLLGELCRILVEVSGYKVAWIAFAENDAFKTVRVAASAGIDPEILAQFRITWDVSDAGRGPGARALRTGLWQLNRDFATAADMAPWRDAYREMSIGSSAAFPLKADAGLIGAIVLVSAEPDAFDTEEIALLETLADNIAHGMQALRLRVAHDELLQHFHRAMDQTVSALATACELHDPYTAGHQRNVARLAESIARHLRRPEAEIDGIRLAASLHDIGKLHIPLEILAKPGRLTTPERRLVQTHVQAGYDILKKIDFSWPVAELVLQHHERLDGSGYPRGLKADAILLGARIIAVADVFDALTASRPYRAMLAPADALAELRKGRCTLYDPAVVNACAAVLQPFEGGQPVRDTAVHVRPVLREPATSEPGGQEAAGSHLRGLTQQQAAVIKLLARGRAVKEIARDLGLSIGTVKTHLSRAYIVLGAHNKVEAMVRARAIGVLPGPDDDPLGCLASPATVADRQAHLPFNRRAGCADRAR